MPGADGSALFSYIGLGLVEIDSMLEYCTKKAIRRLRQSYKLELNEEVN